MNTMQALKFFTEILCGSASILIIAAWLMLFVLRRKVRRKRRIRESEQLNPF